VTRTRGFWGTHPWITNNYGPVDVCGQAAGCSGAQTASQSPTSCTLTPCGTSIMEALGSNGPEYKQCVEYAAFVAQLAAAQLNLAATATLYPDDAQCTEWRSSADLTISQVLAMCNTVSACSCASVSLLTECTAALDDFNNSPDALGDGPTLAPFDRPGVDDGGKVSGADPSAFTQASKTKKVVGKGSCV
jgi:hypothetical protein